MLHHHETPSYSGGVDAITLTDLFAVVAAVLGPTLAAVMALARYQHKDSIETRRLLGEARDEFRTGIAEVRDETRQLLDKARDENRQLLDKARDENRQLLGEVRDENREHRRENGEILKEVVRSLADARERLARIEGHFGIGGSPRDEDGRGTADAA